MTGKCASISTDLLPKEQPSVKRRGKGETNPEKTTIDLEEMEREKRGAENLSIESTYKKGSQIKNIPRTEEGRKKKRRSK
ncbi:hypothetical protein V6N11_065456 [Hibiscus sabdariffa]|uniref:Uncharacterized protein n=1 Tax=Hibiscus sabdariffa TaxID=183260 RepID=A0ABR2PHG6_9ROSI